MFEHAKIRDNVWSIFQGWGKIVDIAEDSPYPIQVRFGEDKTLHFTKERKLVKNTSIQLCFGINLRYQNQYSRNHYLISR